MGDRKPSLERDDFSLIRHPALSFLFEHDLLGKPVPTFPDHALAARRRCWPATGCSLMAVCRLDHLGDVEVAIGAVRNHRLTGLKMELDAIEMH